MRRKKIFPPANDQRRSVPLEEQIVQALACLPFPAYARLVRRLVFKCGYAGVRTLKDSLARHAISPGGLDLVAFAHTDLSTSLTAIQIKQYRGKSVVPRRFVDELRGAMARLHADQGLLVTTSEFSRAAREAASYPHVPPIRLIEGAELAGLLMAQGEGVRIRRLPSHPDGAVLWEADFSYFERLAHEA